MEKGNQMFGGEFQEVPYHDLCITCRYYDSCMYVKSGTRPVYHCEEFEERPVRAAGEKAHPGTPPGKVQKEVPVFQGLCKNCGNRMNCMNANPERIIWHCEEYV